MNMPLIQKKKQGGQILKSLHWMKEVRIYNLEKENQSIVTGNSVKRIVKWYKVTADDGNTLYTILTVIL